MELPERWVYEEMHIMFKILQITRHTIARVALIALTALPLPASALSLHLIPMKASQQKMVTLTLRNRSEVALGIRIGDKVVTLGANERYKLVAPVGTIVYTNGASIHHADGEIILQIIAELDGTTCSFS